MKPTFVFLAAGMSTRYGRLKQLEPVGPGGEALLDYSVFDARKAGFGRVILIIREELEERFREHVEGRWPRDLEVAYHHQRLEDLAGVDASRIPPDLAQRLISERRKPWGTAHALLSAREILPDPFVVLNADDFYGEAAFLKAASILEHGMPPDPRERPVFGLLGYTLKETLSRHGGVSRGICRVDRMGWLESVEEVLGVCEGSGGIQGTTVPGEEILLSGREHTSTNFWIFTPAVFPLLHAGFSAFLEGVAAEAGGSSPPQSRGDEGPDGSGGDAPERPREPEFLIPTEVNGLVAQGLARLKVHHAAGPFFGITHPEDREWVLGEVGKLLEEGRYPDPLWPAES